MNPDLAQLEVMAKEIIRRAMADEDPLDLRKWIVETLARMAGESVQSSIMTWEQSFELVDKLVADYETIANVPERERKNLTWPWATWRNLIDPLEDGMLGVITAPDGAGKTIYAESIAEHWAEHRNRVVFVHYELNRKLMMLRRTARHTSILARSIKEGRLTPAQKIQIAEVRPRLLSWDGFITYVHTPGWSMEQTVNELMRLRSEQQCDVVVVDYLEKAAVSGRQLKMFGTNTYQREADNVEQLKNFAESTGIPVLMVAQMSKAGKSTSFDRVDRTDMRGAGEKSDKANLVVLLSREREADGYSKMVDVLVDKNTMGGTGTFRQIMQPEYYRVADIFRERETL